MYIFVLLFFRREIEFFVFNFNFYFVDSYFVDISVVYELDNLVGEEFIIVLRG